MSYSFVLIDKSCSVDLKALNKELSQNYADYELVYCSTKKSSKLKNVISFVFDEKDSTESIVNAVLKKCTKQNLVVIRKFGEFQDLKKLTDAHQNADQIIYFERKVLKFKAGLNSFFEKIIKFMFGKNIMPMSHSIVLYAENPTQVLKNLELPSNLMRANAWQGVQFKSVQGGQPYKFEYNLKKRCLKTIIPFVLGVLVFASTFVFRHHTTRLFKIFQLAVSLVAFVCFAVYGLEWILKSKIGENEIKLAKIKGDKNETN